MALARRQRATTADYWPGFVDALATLLLVLIFLLSIFMIAQFLLSREITGQESALNKLENEVAELSRLLDLEKSGKSAVDDQLSALNDRLASLLTENQRLAGEAAAAAKPDSSARISGLEDTIAEERKLKGEALSRIDLLNQQIAALRRQLASIERALDASEARETTSRSQIKDLGERLNAALARKVQRLEQYRSEFFGRLREILSQRSDIRVVGDRFIFQAEVLFAKGDAGLNEAGRAEIDKLAIAITELSGQIPDDIPWVLRVDGHTDADPIATPQYPSNWHLSAARAISVVRYLVSKGVAANRLVAAGFGEFQPIEPGETPEAFTRNRRIELKLTER